MTRQSVLTILVLLSAACRTAPTSGREPERAPPPEARPDPAQDAAERDRAYYEGTERMRRQAADLIAAVPAADEVGKLEIARKLGALGEPAMPQIVGALRHPNPSVRSLMAWTLGFTNDRRTIPALVEATADPYPLVSLEAATARVRLGDDRGLLRLVQGLEDPDPRIRAKSLGVLLNRTGKTYDFLPDDPPAERAAALERWKTWLAQRGLSG